MRKTVVLDIVGLSSRLIGEHTPFLNKYIAANHLSTIQPMLPAVTTAVQSTYLTGKMPCDHGIVGNGWYNKQECDIKFWQQSNKLVEAEKLYEKAKRKDPSFTCAKMFWWYNMYSAADYSVTPRPQYHADGVKVPDCYAYPADLREELQQKLGQFPLFNFWGPGANIKSSRWIADASMIVDEKYDPTLTLIYLPHLDYCLQKFGQDFSKIDQDLQQIDEVCADLINYYKKKNAQIILLSEYGITDVNHPVHINRLLRKSGLLSIRTEKGHELLDPGASKAFAVADHQVAHVYINDPSCEKQVVNLLENTPGVEKLLSRKEKQENALYHERAGDYIAVADEHSWFTYYYWLDDTKAPDFARLVEIHKKPGYDPVEMFMTSKARAGYKLLKKKLGFRYLMDVIPLDANLIKGSHGRVSSKKEDHPVLITSTPQQQNLKATDIYHVIWQQLNGGQI